MLREKRQRGGEVVVGVSFGFGIEIEFGLGSIGMVWTGLDWIGSDWIEVKVVDEYRAKYQIRRWLWKRVAISLVLVLKKDWMGVEWRKRRKKRRKRRKRRRRILFIVHRP